jgi:site-specific recombinase XerD
MTTDTTFDLVPVTPPPGLSTLKLERVASYVHASRAASTLRGYRADWRDFESWCHEHGATSLPAAPTTVASYISAVADRGLKVGSIQRRISAIAAAHTAAGHDSPPTASAAVRLCMAGIRRTLGVYQEGKNALLTSDLVAMIARLPNNRKGLRDRALLLIGFAGAFRRSELVGLNVADLEFGSEGLKVLIRKSKTDQEGEGQKIGIPPGQNLATCPLAALQNWLHAAGITEGPIFRPLDRHMNVKPARLRDQSVALVVKQYGGLAGLDQKKIAAHSLRAGLVTQAAICGVPERVIMLQTRHKSSDMLRRYIRETTLFRDNAAGRVGL